MPKFAFYQLLCIVSGPPTNLFSTHGDIHLPDQRTVKCTERHYMERSRWQYYIWQSPRWHHVIFVLEKKSVYLLIWSSILCTSHLLARFNPWKYEPTCFLFIQNNWFSGFNSHLFHHSLPTRDKIKSMIGRITNSVHIPWQYMQKSKVIITPSIKNHIQCVFLTMFLFWLGFFFP